MQVFISHSRSDEALADRLAAALESAGIAVWNPNTVYPGDNLALAIGEALESADVMIALFTRPAEKRPNVVREVQFALTRGNYRGRVIPVFCFPTAVAGKEVPWILMRMDPIQLPNEWADLHEVVDRVAALAKEESDAAT